MGLGLEPADPRQMLAPPRRRDHGLFRTANLLDIMFYGVVVGGIGLLNFYVSIYGWGDGNLGHDCNNKSYNESCYLVYRGRGALFATECILLLLHSFTCRDLRNIVWLPSYFAGERRWYLAWIPAAFTTKQNWYLYYAFAFSAILLVITLYVPVYVSRGPPFFLLVVADTDINV